MTEVGEHCLLAKFLHHVFKSDFNLFFPFYFFVSMFLVYVCVQDFLRMPFFFFLMVLKFMYLFKLLWTDVTELVMGNKLHVFVCTIS